MGTSYGLMCPQRPPQISIILYLLRGKELSTGQGSGDMTFNDFLNIFIFADICSLKRA